VQNNVHNALLVEGIQLEALGGDIPSVEISGLTGQGLDQLVETITAVAEMQELRTDHEGQACGRIIESKLQKGLG
jgi:translation initiation factor IF-2